MKQRQYKIITTDVSIQMLICHPGEIPRQVKVHDSATPKKEAVLAVLEELLVEEGFDEPHLELIKREGVRR